MIHIVRVALCTLVLSLTAAGLIGCEVYPSGCVKIESYEEPFPSAWNPYTLAVVHDPPGPQPLTFVGVKARRDQADIWHGPFGPEDGLIEYASSITCYQTGGQFAT